MKNVLNLATFTKLLLCLYCLCSTVVSFGQNKAAQIAGTVTGTDGQKIIGANVSVLNAKGIGATTNLDGQFSIKLPDNLQGANITLLVSFIGYDKKEVNATAGQTNLLIQLEVSSKALNELVVTALGIKKEKKATAYAITEVKGSDFTKARAMNLGDALSGKVAGVNASSLAGGPGASSRVVIRGTGSLNGDDQPLYVINGMPIDNTTAARPSNGNGSIGLNQDRGDGIGGINPDDIESITVLKGGPAAALYGSRAANGVILITTKKGVKQKGIGVDYNGTFTLESPSVTPDWQYEYGSGVNGLKPATQNEAISAGRLSWGPKIDGSPVIQFDGVIRPYVAQKNNIKNFYNLGNTLTNTVGFSGGNESASFRASLSDMNNRGLVPNQHLNKKIFSLGVNANLSKRLTVEGFAQYNIERSQNRTGVGDATGNPNWGTYMIANTVDIRNLEPGYDKNGNEVKWNPSEFATNPYFAVNKFRNHDDRNRFIGNLGIKYNLLDNFFVRGRVTTDHTSSTFVGIVPSGTAYYTDGYYLQTDNAITETNAELTLNYNARISQDLQLTALAGGNRRKSVNDATTMQGRTFFQPGFYDPSNVLGLTTTVLNQRLATNSLFGSVDLNFRDYLYLSVTGRNDWFSTLAATSNNIFYPSVGASFLLSEAVSLPKWIDYAKIRTSWAQVGGGAPMPYALNQTYSMVPGGGHNNQPLQTPTQTTGTTSGELIAPNPYLKPYTSTTAEIGLEGRFANNRIGFDLTLYQRRTVNDIMRVTISSSAGYNYAYLNVGEMSNKGVELLINGTPYKNKHFSWDVSLNVAYNRNRVESLNGLNSLELDKAVNSYAFLYAQVGKPYSSIMGYGVKKDANGNTMYNKTNGYELTTGLQDYGTGIAPTTGGITNTFHYKRFDLSFLIDGRFGNKIYSGTNLYGTRFGLTKITLPGRTDGLTVTGVDADGKPFTKTFDYAHGIQQYYDNWKNISEKFIYDGSFIKLRQVVFSYNIPTQLLSFAKVQQASVSFVARNLLILYKNAPNIDPESTFSNASAQGFEMFGVPPTRSYGLNLNVKF